ncbi:MAG: hypothetical protein L0H55_08375, partial [Candidatus Nitrosocosmicus sp.]|nr:hypothetical protein [Candidatus Nitrosocosmicus sp.]
MAQNKLSKILPVRSLRGIMDETLYLNPRSLILITSCTSPLYLNHQLEYEYYCSKILLYTHTHKFTDGYLANHCSY